jgi:hypothetical protein
MRARFPRSQLRLSPDELLPGEHGILREFDVVISEDRRIYINKSATLVSVFGPDKWHDRPVDEGKCLIRRDEDGYTLVVPRNFITSTRSNIMDHKYHIAISKLELIDESKICHTCRGRGYL